MRHDHPLEWWWLLFAFVDLWASLSSWLAAHNDWARAKAARVAAGIPHLSHSSRDAVTKAIQDSATMNAIMAAALFIAAIASMFLAPPPPNYREVPQSLFLLSVLIGVSTINAMIAFHGRLVRYRLSHGYYERPGPIKPSVGGAIVDAAIADRTAGHVIAEAYQDKEPP